MIKCLVKMKTRCFLLGILYVAGIFRSFSNSHGIVVPDYATTYVVNHTWTSWSSLKNSSNPPEPIVNENSDGPKICQQRIITNINNRYASTVVTTRVANPVNTAQEYIFSYFFPNNAFLTGFVIEINGKNFTSYVTENEEARKQYKSVGTIESSKSEQIRNSQKFSISINLEALSMATLYLSYEEMLVRNQGRYEHVLNIFPGQVLEDLLVEIFLMETKKITNLKVPNIRSGNEIENQDKELDPQAFVSEDHHSGVGNSVRVLFMPNEQEQRKFARIMKIDESSGFAGQFVVQYDVENHKEFGEIIVSNGYFANFFHPQGLDPLTKHVVFVLDTSGSMKGKRITQLKVAMKQMLKQLQKNDLMSLVEFNKVVKVWNLESQAIVTYTANKDLKKISFPKPFQATPGNVKKAMDCVDKFNAKYGTDILSALKVGLQLVELGKKFDKIQRLPLVMFLTDGEPTIGEKSPQGIKAQVTKFNRGLKRSPISTLAFGNGANPEFLENLAMINMGHFKHIYDAEDSQLQIEDFFNTISVPVLTNVNFKYDFSKFRNITTTKFPVCYDGSELIVAGQYDSSKAFNQPAIEALSAKGPLGKQVLQVYNSTTDISHLWAYVTTKELLSTIRSNSRMNSEEYKKRTLDVSLKYSYVTPVTSMVVVKPNEKVVLGTAELTVDSNSKPNPVIDENMRYEYILQG